MRSLSCILPSRWHHIAHVRTFWFSLFFLVIILKNCNCCYCVLIVIILMGTIKPLLAIYYEPQQVWYIRLNQVCKFRAPADLCIWGKNFRSMLNDSLVLYHLLMVNKINQSQLSDLERKITKDLVNYKKIIGPLQIMKSNVGLKLTKFHWLLHILFFITEYRVLLNFSKNIWKIF